MILPHINEIASLCAAHGITQAVISPGSRSAAISLAFENHPDIEVKVVADERSAAFIALGIAQQSRSTVAIICTSGSAVYNYAPAVAEAYYQEIPLLIITADRPTEWVDQYDGQTIQQEGIYGKHVKKSFSLPVDVAHRDARWHSNRLINESILETQHLPKGPVHLNVPIREPFYPVAEDIFDFLPSRRIEVIQTNHTLNDVEWDKLIEIWSNAKNKLVVLGQLEPDKHLTQALQTLRSKTSITVLNEITANQHGLEGVISKQDLFLQHSDAVESPELLITIGKSLISKNLKVFLRKNPPQEHWHVHQGSKVNDALQHLTKSIALNPSYFLAELAERVEASSPNDYSNQWKKIEAGTSSKCNEYLTIAPFGELKAASVCLSKLPKNSQLHLANSMSIRYANFIGLQESSIEVFCNRGTSGIDGSNGTAVGAALTNGKLTTLLSGDMAFLYDRNAFWHSYDLSNLRIIVLNNAGGGIFGMIKGPKSQKSYEKLFQTEQKLTAELTAKEFGFEYHRVDHESQLENTLNHFFEESKTAKVLEVFSNARENEEIFSAFKNYCLGL